MSVDLFSVAGHAAPPARGLILVCVFGVLGVLYGGALVFNVRGATDALIRMRQAKLEREAQKIMSLTHAERRALPTWFFRVLGGIVFASGVFMLFMDVFLYAY
ncbi:hypothetical protein ABZ484_19595 [Streptomyces sp. NPDC006393]|uniref:hypothetical protein n=1 Tax=Streptomyces sp. NPDC006393 TaxID=3156763 RepID=UPI0033D416F1